MKRLIPVMLAAPILAFACTQKTQTEQSPSVVEPAKDEASVEEQLEQDMKEARPMESPPTALAKMAVGSGTLGSIGRMSGAGGAKMGAGVGAMRSRYAPNPGEFDPNIVHNTEAYDHIDENGFMAVEQNPLSTFSIDVDTASYSNVRRFINEGSRPPKDSVRIEELVNYFRYDYPEPDGKDPFSVNVEISTAPWAPEHRLARIGLKAQEIDMKDAPNSNIVFLLDVSGSMESPNKLPLVKKSLKMMVENLGAKDRVAMVVYAGASGLVLPSTPCSDRGTILAAIENLRAGGSTNGGAGIELAYKTAVDNFIKGGVNRVILATDGDFNVGVSSSGDLTRLIEEKAKSGVFLTVLGLGMGNYKDSTLEKLADKGNGSYAYIDSQNEARKVMVEQIGGSLITVAKDVKIQVEFNPLKVAAYRLIGYENRMLRAEDFNNDKKDAGEIGAGHTVTALYELVPVGADSKAGKVDPLKYQKPSGTTAAASANEIMTVKVRYKQPDGDVSKLLEFPVADTDSNLASASEDFKFAAAVAGFGMLLRESDSKGEATMNSILKLAEEGMGEDRFGYRSEFVGLLRSASRLN